MRAMTRIVPSMPPPMYMEISCGYFPRREWTMFAIVRLDATERTSLCRPQRASRCVVKKETDRFRPRCAIAPTTCFHSAMLAAVANGEIDLSRTVTRPRLSR